MYSGGRLGGSLISAVPVERRNGGNTTKSRRNNTNLVLRLAIVNILIIILPRACSLPMIQLAGVHLIIEKRWVGLDIGKLISQLGLMTQMRDPDIRNS